MTGELPPAYSRRVVQEVFKDQVVPPVAHPGLVFDRYLRVWDARGTGLVTEKSEALSRFVGEYRELARSNRVLPEMLDDVHRRLDRIEGVEKRTFRSEWRLVSGMGAPHPLENGFAFDRILGVPFLAGSSIKGLCRAYAHSAFAESLMSPEQIALLFGREPTEDEATTGDVIFLPSFPSQWPELVVDIINCHHPSYYSSGPSREDPSECESPVPVFFLAAKEGTEFVFRLASRSRSGSNMKAAWDLLGGGLQGLGIGGKTAVGYGVMAPA